jgi:hypothetical protein
MQELIEENRKRTREMYSQDISVQDLESFGLDKKRAYLKDKYTGFNQIPAISTTDIMRQRALKDLGVSQGPQLHQSVIPSVKEEKKEATS